ncbi:MAG TPA: nucleoside diphosphate kinase regulator [Syntrophorhabdaceae bacterium]|nr:nucleoside diphosphate kinase regulator [Syntrophorhabdaceae bacterium]
MKKKQIYITQHDMERLRALMEVYAENTELLEEMLDKARIVLPKDIPHNVVTMNSTVRVKDIDTGEERTFTLVFPGNKAGNDAVSILAPAGTALIGSREKDIVERQVPAGKKRMEILEIIYQPEREGKYDI